MWPIYGNFQFQRGGDLYLVNVMRIFGCVDLEKQEAQNCQWMEKDG